MSILNAVFIGWLLSTPALILTMLAIHWLA